MDKTELLAIWKELRGLKVVMFRIAMMGEGVQRALDASTPGFQEQRTKQEKIAAEFYGRLHDGEIRAIDAVIQRLEPPGNLVR